MAPSRPRLIAQTHRALLIGALLVPSASPLAAQPFPYEQWVCEQGPKGWQCARRDATPGAYPQPERPPVQAPRDRGAEADTDAPAASPAAPRNEWDYVPKAELSETQACDLKPGCRGRYIEPTFDNSGASGELRASAESSTLQGNTAELSGNVTLEQNGLRLRADSAQLDRNTRLAHLEGHVVVRKPGELVRGDAAQLNTDTQLGHVDGARYLNYASGVRATAQRLTRTDEQRLTLDDARFTQCTPDDETWLLSASHIDIDNAEGWGSAKHMVLRIKDVPVLYLPYATFPIDDRRKSGLLWPSFASDSENGLDVAVPFYWNIAPQADATLTPRYIDKRGEMLEAELRHLSGWGNWDFAGAFLENDELIERDRWLGGVNHEGRIGAGGYTEVEFTRVSDDDYFRDLDTTSLEVRRATHLEQRGELGYAGQIWLGSIEVLRYQTLDETLDEAYQRMPRVVFTRREQGANFAPEWLWDSEVTVFDHEDAIEDGGSFVTGTRAYVEPGVSFPMRSAWGYLVPSAKLRHVTYELDEVLPGAEDAPSTTAPLASLDSGLIFERDAGRHVHTLEPRLYYVYSEFQEGQGAQPLFDTQALSFNYTQLFNDRRFSGYDRLEDFDQAAVGITSRLIDRRSGLETLSASLGQIFYFDERQVVLEPPPTPEDGWSNSAMAAQLNWQPSRSFWTSANILWESRHDRVQEGGVMLHFAPEQRRVFNLGYRYRRPDPTTNALTRELRQADGSVALPLGDRWHVVARLSYDLDEHSSLEELVGLEYDACCVRYRIAFQRAADDADINSAGQQELERDTRVLLEFQLKGLGNIGDRIGSILEESIFGYRDQDS